MNESRVPNAPTSPRRRLLRLLFAAVTLLTISGAFGAASATALPKIDIAGSQPSDFHAIVVSADATSITAQFDYDGGPHEPVMTVGTKADVFASPVGWAKAVRIAPGRMSATVFGLQSGTQHWIRIDNTRSTGFGQARTMRRNVTVDLQEIHVLTDGDSGPRGCGDFSFSFKANDRETYQNDVCLDDGESWLKMPGSTVDVPWFMPSGFGKWTFADYRFDTVRVRLSALDNDESGSVWGCGGPTSDECGDLAFGMTDWDSLHPGTRHEYLTVRGQGVHVQARVDVTVAYVAW